MDEMTCALLSGANKVPEFHEAVDIVKRNSSGNIWLVGGFVYRTIASVLYGLKMPRVDFDFIVEVPVEKFILSDGWQVLLNSFGNPKFVCGEKKIDYVPLRSVYSIRARHIPATIDNFFSGNPLNVHSIAFDVYAGVVCGDVGIDAIKRRVVEVNNLEFAEYDAKRRGKSVNELISEKAHSLNFTPVFPCDKKNLEIAVNEWENEGGHCTK
ncbi:hypothetical protein HY484_03090 [Candidatus Woesearchaeota archaeon]|nr:hypothetical protein [Candidatus Woesearchaeota archaeon]